MNFSFFQKEKDFKLLTNIYNSLQGKPFLNQETTLRGKEIKVEFYYLDQSKYYSTLFQSRQFAVWTVDKGVCRLLVERKYYKKFGAFYQKDINDMWLDFIWQIFQKEATLIKTIKLLFVAVLLPILLNVFLLNGHFSGWVRVPAFFVLISSCFSMNYWMKKQQKKLHIFRDQKLQETLEKIKQKLGKELYESLKEKQKQFNPTFVEPKSDQNPNEDNTGSKDNTIDKINELN
ncbi:conserved hypothetical protein [Aster yellows witches'-broom phytoplasma AYWB]|uniref:Transmembrane protein n=1 Tax=Aster yellows witches'-broom phytoplasma (strain AYWB) TaxID=322098 RepID=Q2NJ24_AYWBP|nr:hypothetical protein [Aster yellows witches'-broom phytoplasma]ABC65569.1 conserved hypothetical protein [Aster yellows witches'-broom phytoplasma AYWB]